MHGTVRNLFIPLISSHAVRIHVYVYATVIEISTRNKNDHNSSGNSTLNLFTMTIMFRDRVSIQVTYLLINMRQIIYIFQVVIHVFPGWLRLTRFHLFTVRIPAFCRNIAVDWLLAR